MQEPIRRRWRVADSGDIHGSICISGLDWGGDRPIALLHHANGFCAAIWKPVARLLKSRYRVIAIDARGHGESDAPALPEGVHWNRFADDLASVAEQILKETGRARIHYGIGSSLGGTVTAIAESRRPNTFARIALLDPPLHPGDEWIRKLEIDPSTMRFAKAGLAAQARHRRAMWPSRSAVEAAWKDKSAFQDWEPEAFDLYVEACLRDLADGSVSLKCRPAIEAAVFKGITGIDALKVAAHVSCPALIVHAMRGMFPQAIHQLFASRFSNGTYIEADAGHLIPLEVPTLCALMLEDFDSGSPSGPSGATVSVAC